MEEPNELVPAPGGDPPAGPVWAVIVAAGAGVRFGGPKPYEPLGDERVLDHSLAAARTVADGIVLVVPPARHGAAEPAADVVVAGGASRAASVRAGLGAVPPEASIVLVHDAARPLASRRLFRSVLDAVRDGAQAVVPGVDVVDTLRDRDGGVVERDRLVAVQTPQGFGADLLRRSHAGGADATDDASLAEAIGAVVTVVPGEAWNLKITAPVDLEVAEALLRSRARDDPGPRRPPSGQASGPLPSGGRR